jgi:hypothetical protein
VTRQAKYESQASATSQSDELGPWLPSIPKKTGKRFNENGRK